MGRAGPMRAELASVFSSSGGDGDNCHEICAGAGAARAREMSPDAISQLRAQRRRGLLEHCNGRQARIERAVRLRCELRRRPAGSAGASGGRGAAGAARRLRYGLSRAAARQAPDSGCLRRRVRSHAASRARLRGAHHGGLGAEPADPLDDPRLEALRASTPAARCLPLLQRLAKRAPGAHGTRLPRRIETAVRVEPCSLNRAWIEAHIPHSGRMCLLDEVICWDPRTASAAAAAGIVLRIIRCAHTAGSALPAASKWRRKRWPFTAR